MGGGENQGSREGPGRRRLEAAGAAIGAFLALATLGIIAWGGVAGGGGPALVSLRAGAITPHDGGFVVAITARNDGAATAAALLVEGSLLDGDRVVETSEATFDYLAGRSQRLGALVFAADPRRYRLVVRAKSHVEP